MITSDVGGRRLDDPTDWVRTEIKKALERDVRVIPILISGTIMPRKEELPVDLKPLVKRQAWELSDRHWRQDLDILVEALDKIPGMRQRTSIATGSRTSSGTAKTSTTPAAGGNAVIAIEVELELDAMDGLRKVIFGLEKDRKK